MTLREPPFLCDSSQCRKGEVCIRVGTASYCHCLNNSTDSGCSQVVPLDFTTSKPWTTTENIGPNALPIVASAIPLALVLLLCFACWWRVKKRCNQRLYDVHRGNMELPNGSHPTHVQIFRLSSVTEQVHDHRHFHQQLRFQGDAFVEIEIDGSTAHHAYDPTRDLPPSYLSVVGQHKYVSEGDSQVDPPPSYDEAVGATRLPAAATTNADSVSEHDSNITSLQGRVTHNRNIDSSIGMRQCHPR